MDDESRSNENLTKRPPSAVEVERVVLGAMILDVEAVPKVMETLTTGMFL